MEPVGGGHCPHLFHDEGNRVRTGVEEIGREQMLGLFVVCGDKPVVPTHPIATKHHQIWNHVIPVVDVVQR